jgi:hypothetical protein
MFQRKTVALALTLTAAPIAPAIGQGAHVPEAHACFAQVADLATLTAACQHVIGDGSAGADTRAQAYLRRAYALAQTGGKDDIARALADLAEASRLAPSNQDVQKYVLDARTTLQRSAEVAQPKGAEADKKGGDQVELLEQELKNTQERLAALEAAKAPAAPDPTKAAPRPARLPTLHTPPRVLPPPAAEPPPFALPPPLVQPFVLAPPVIVLSPPPRMTAGSHSPPPTLRPPRPKVHCTGDICRVLGQRRHRLERHARHTREMSERRARHMRVTPGAQHRQIMALRRARHMRIASTRQARHMRTMSTRQARHMRISGAIRSMRRR